MSREQIGGRIVTDGLLMSLDAGDSTSYPGTGTTWYDLSGNGRNGTLYNGTGYSTTNGGTFTFDGVNDGIVFSSFFPLYSFTISMWFSSDGTTPTTGTSPALFGFTYGLSLFVYQNNLRYVLDNGSSTTNLYTPSTFEFYDSSWHQVVVTATPNSMSIYVDGTVQGTTSTTWSGTTRWPTNTFNIGRDNNNTMYWFRGKIPTLSIYERELSSVEISQNFNTTRSRFGI